MQGQDLTFKAKDLIPESNLGYRKNYKSEKFESSNKYKSFVSHFTLCENSKVKVHQFLKS